jgi:hypothetical protein
MGPYNWSCSAHPNLSLPCGSSLISNGLVAMVAARGSRMLPRSFYVPSRPGIMHTWSVGRQYHSETSARTHARTHTQSRARDGLELEEGTRRRLYSKVVAGLGPGPRRRAGAMAEAHGAPGRQGPKPI